VEGLSNVQASSKHPFHAFHQASSVEKKHYSQISEFISSSSSRRTVQYILWRKSTPKALQFEKLHGMREGASEVERRTAEALAQLQHGRNIGEERGEREVSAMAAASIVPENTQGGSMQKVLPQCLTVALLSEQAQVFLVSCVE